MRTAAILLTYSAALWVMCGALYFGDWKTAVATMIGTALAALPTVAIAERRIAENAGEQLLGSVTATTERFASRVMQLTYDHTQALTGMAREVGAANARAQDAQAKVERMTSRPRVGGKFVSSEDAKRYIDSAG